MADRIKAFLKFDILISLSDLKRTNLDIAVIIHVFEKEHKR